MSRRSKKTHFLTGWLFVSIYVHLSVLAVLAILMSMGRLGCNQDVLDMPLEVALVPTDQVSPLVPELEETKEELKKSEKKEIEEEKKMKGQVVDLPAPLEEQRPEKSRFLAEHDAKVKKETKGPPVPFKPGKIIPKHASPPRPPAQPPPSPSEQQEVERKAMKLAMRPRPEIPRSEADLTDKGEKAAKKDRAPELPEGPESKDAPETSAQKRVTMKDLQLSDRELASAMGTRANDYLKDVEKGGQTLLNTRRWRFATFFNRVKRQVAENWHPDRVYRRRDPRGNVYGFRDRLTILRIHLSPKGKLKDLHLVKPCGVGFLDDEAMAAFRAAAPFPNPPKGLVDKESGLISFRFGFLFEISHRTGFKIFRYKD